MVGFCADLSIPFGQLAWVGVNPGTAPRFRAAVGRNAAFMGQRSGLTPDCRINAAFRGQCPEALAGEFCVISPLTGPRFIGMVALRFGWASKHGELIGFSSTRKQ
jgi:hypothetical protein